MGGGNTSVQRYILAKLALHAQLHPARADYVGIEGCTPVDAPMRLSSPLRKANWSWLTDAELAGTDEAAAIESVRTAGLKLWQSGQVECATICRRKARHGQEMWRMAFRLPTSEEDRAFCAAWDDWFRRRDEAIFEAACSTLSGKRTHARVRAPQVIAQA